jgi:hypothetical protein
MESIGKFEKIFIKLLEDNTAGAGGAFGDGPSMHNLYVPDEAGTGKKTSNTPGDSRLAKPLGAVQTRKGAVGKKKKKNKKQKGVDFASGEENEENIPEEDAEKKKKADRCKRRADSVYGKKTSAYKSGAIVRCRQGKIWKKKK